MKRVRGWTSSGKAREVRIRKFPQIVELAHHFTGHQSWETNMAKHEVINCLSCERANGSSAVFTSTPISFPFKRIAKASEAADQPSISRSQISRRRR